MKNWTKYVILTLMGSMLLCGCGKKEEVTETIASTPNPIEATIAVEIEPDVTIEEHKGNTEIHVDEKDLAPTEQSAEDAELEKAKIYLEVTSDDIAAMDAETFKQYLISLCVTLTPGSTENDFEDINNFTDEDIRNAKQILVEELNNVE